MDNASLIEQCSAGSKEAMESLYCRYSMRMMRVIRRYVNDTKCCEDILHDGFVLIFTHISEVRQPERLEFWMGTIMKNLCLNYLSNLDVMTILDDDIEMPEVPDLDDILSYEELEQLINRLPYGYRTVFKLAVLEGKSHKEIGRLLGISPHSSSSQLFHAKALLRKLIIEHRKQAGLILLSLLIAIGAFIALNRGNIPDKSIYIAEIENAHADDNEEESITGNEEIEEEPVYSPLKKIRFEQNETSVASVVAADIVDTAFVVNQPKEEIHENASDTVIVRKSEEFSRRNTYADIPRKAIAKLDWTIGAHYALGTQTPSMADRDELSVASSPWSPDKAGDLYADPVPMPPPSFYNEVDYDLPMTFGLSVAKKINSRLSFETGVNYTYMRATISYTSLRVNRIVKSSFVGIPVKFDYTVFNRSRFSFYTTAGASIDFPVGTKEKMNGTVNYPMPVEFPALKSKLEISVHGGLGLQYSITPAVGLYIEPSVRHYFKNSTSSPSYWQEHRTIISVPVGIKINF